MSQDKLELQEKVNEALEVELKNARARYGDKFENRQDFMIALESEQREMQKEAWLCNTHFIELIGRDIKKSEVESIKDYSIKCAMKAIQVACVCEKWLDGNK